MKTLVPLLFLALIHTGFVQASEELACNMNALTKAERAKYGKVTRSLMRAVQEQKELQEGFAFRLPRKALPTVAEWVSLESRCCPFFTFGIDVTKDNGPIWLRVTGPDGVKAFIQDELGL